MWEREKLHVGLILCNFEWNNPLCHFSRSSLFAFLLVLMVGGILQVYHYYYTHADLLNALSRLTFAHCGRCLFNYCMQWLHSLHTLSTMPIFLCPIVFTGTFLHPCTRSHTESCLFYIITTTLPPPPLSPDVFMEPDSGVCSLDWWSSSLLWLHHFWHSHHHAQALSRGVHPGLHKPLPRLHQPLYLHITHSPISQKRLMLS